MQQLSLSTPAEGFIDITGQVRRVVAAGTVQSRHVETNKK